MTKTAGNIPAVFIFNIINIFFNIVLIKRFLQLRGLIASSIFYQDFDTGLPLQYAPNE